MKKKIVASLLALVMLVSVLTACGSNKEKEAALVGSWISTSMTANGQTQTFQDLADLAGIELADIAITMTFTDDGKMTMSGAGQEESGTWKVSGDNYEVTVADGTDTIKIVDGKIVLEESDDTGISMTFEKQ